MKGFINFVREQGVVGFAVGIILGGSVKDLVNSFVKNIIDPFVGLVLGKAGNLTEYSLTLGTVDIGWGSFVKGLIDFVVIALVVYISVKVLKLDRLDKKKK